MRFTRTSLFTVSLLLCALSMGSYAQRGARTLPRGLDQLTQEADVILHGSVVSTKVEPHPQLKNLMTVVVSMKVSETLKGTPRKSFVFRQYIWDLRDQADAAQYYKGQELLLCMGPVSDYGLSSPVGLEQGRFRILRNAKGELTAVNGRGNAGLFDKVGERSQSRGVKLPARVNALVSKPQTGPIPLAVLKDAIRSLEGNQ